jgi:hypothetical protein
VLHHSSATTQWVDPTPVPTIGPDRASARWMGHLTGALLEHNPHLVYKRRFRWSRFQPTAPLAGTSQPQDGGRAPTAVRPDLRLVAHAPAPIAGSTSAPLPGRPRTPEAA